MWIAMAGICSLSVITSVQAQNKNFIDQPYLEVSGMADTSVTPDEIYLHIQISEADTKGKTSVEDLERKMVDALKSLGIDPEKNLFTSDLASNFQSYFLRGKQILKSKDYMLRVSTAVEATQVLIRLQDMGISNISLDHADYSKKEQVRNKMLARAIEDAYTKARAMVMPLHQNIGKAIHIVETGAGPIMPLQANEMKMSVRTYVQGQEAEPLPQIDFEKIKIQSSVNVVFALE
ncbi:hypothetical protein SAMN05660895_1491 [Thermoflavifilum thermophilum]|uniref:SIMPL domain-containing protein n=2 Tax=Thermoflavifilum thermophilum TaxID=1393122 RepID=A0A1I7NDY4_9BACT|nr:hypothetical protein SAMN05660895_1491 [Thermoflavifilum thermophilum]